MTVAPSSRVSKCRVQPTSSISAREDQTVQVVRNESDGLVFFLFLSVRMSTHHLYVCLANRGRPIFRARTIAGSIPTSPFRVMRRSTSMDVRLDAQALGSVDL